MRPPQQKPVMPSRDVSPLPLPLAKATAASRSLMTCASGTLSTMGRIGIDRGELRDVALARVHLHRDREVAGLGEAAADVLDVLVDAEDLLDDEDDREGPSGRGHGAVGRNLGVRRLDLDLARLEPGGVGRDHRLGGDGLHGQCKAGCQRGRKHMATRKVGIGGEAQAVQLEILHWVAPSIKVRARFFPGILTPGPGAKLRRCRPISHPHA